MFLARFFSRNLTHCYKSCKKRIDFSRSLVEAIIASKINVWNVEEHHSSHGRWIWLTKTRFSNRIYSSIIESNVWYWWRWHVKWILLIKTLLTKGISLRIEFESFQIDERWDGEWISWTNTSFNSSLHFETNAFSDDH